MPKQKRTRILTKKLKTLILDFIKENKGKKIIISNIFSDLESKKFSEKIEKFLIKENYKIHEHNEIIYDEPVYGIIFTSDKKWVEIGVCEEE